MPGFTVKPRQSGPGRGPGNGPGSPTSRPDHIGEIDTAAPIESVKAAVSMFGEVSSFRSRPIARRTDEVHSKEPQSPTTLREIEQYKDHLKTMESAKTRAQNDLKRAHRTLRELTKKLEALNEQKQASIKATEESKIRADELEAQKALQAQPGPDAWKSTLENERESYKLNTNQLIASNQELTNLREEFETALALKIAASRKSEAAKQKVDANKEKQSQIQNEIRKLRKSLSKIEYDENQAEEEHSRVIAEKESWLESRKLAKEEAEKEVKKLREEYEHEPDESLREKLEETTEEVKVLQEQAKEIHSSDLYALKTTFSELEKSKKSLEETLEEIRSLQSFISITKQELEEVKNERLKELKAEKAAGRMRGKLQKMFELEELKTELEMVMLGSTSNMQSSINKLLQEAEQAIRDADESKEKAKVLKEETEVSRMITKEAEEKLKAALEDVEVAKTTAAENASKNSVPGREIRLSTEEFELMKRKIDEFENEADVKVAIAKAQTETISNSEKVISKKLSDVLKENEALETRINDAVKSAGMAEAARSIVEKELAKWRLNESNKSKAT